MNTGAWRIAVLFTASALGGTFLGGDELLRFFSHFGSWGTIGLLLTSFCLTWFGYTVMKYCQKAGIASFPALITSLVGPKAGPSLTFFLYLILLSFIGVMIGNQAERFSPGESYWIIAAILFPCAVAFWLVLQGWRQLKRACALVLLTLLLLLGLILTDQRHIPIPSFTYQMNSVWFWYALFYLALHFFLVLTILIPLAAESGSLRTIRLGMGIGAVLYTGFVMLGHLIILAYWHDVHSSPQPLLDILSSMFPIGRLFYVAVSIGQSIICLACLFYGLTIPLAERSGLQVIPLLLVMFSTAVLLSFFPIASDLYAYLISVAATYCGMAVLLLFFWKHRY